MARTVNIGLLGCGNVGSALVEQIQDRAAEIERRTGVQLRVGAIAVRSVSKERQARVDPELLTTDAHAVVKDPSIDLVVEAWDFIAPAYYLSLGFAVPGSIGVQLARPGTRPLVIVGDGAFQMTGMELTSAVRYGLDPIVIVLDNAGYGTERPMLDGPFNDVVPWHYERLPELLGAGRGYDVRTEDDLDAALGAARSERGEFALLRVHLEPDDMSIDPQLGRIFDSNDPVTCGDGRGEEVQKCGLASSGST